MLSYIHAFHAGNHADILKHLTLSLSLEHMTKKEKPLTVFDTHAGSGLYKLGDERLQKTGEAESGVKRLFSPEILESEFFRPLRETTFFKIVSDYFKKGEYPGSPLIESHFLRQNDEQILSELHPRTIEELRFNMKGRPVKPKIHFRSGFEMLLALSPPKTKRGIAIIDPSFEEKSDFEECTETICSLLKKWSGAAVLLWYPLVSHRKSEISSMMERIASCVQDEEKILDIRLQVKDESEMTGLASLYGSGMLAVNPAFGLKEKMEIFIPILEKIFRN